MPVERPWIVLVDFDGTLTTRDADFEVADLLLPPERAGAYLPAAGRYERLELTTRDYYQEWLRVLGCGIAQITAAARRVPLRDDARQLLTLGLPLRVVSEGLDAYVLPALQAGGLGELPVSCNRLDEGPHGLEVHPAAGAVPCPRCLNCKGAHVRRERAHGRRVAIVGDGASDLCAAREADLVFARGSLAEHCVREGIPHRRWSSLAEVRTALSSLVAPTFPSPLAAS
ncbi:MAG: HAD-IB family phosphatase [Myxococcota bacterium]|jgi:HAD superfamily phosphoserine phosphatase-like hydrolase|nr:HAD-IB family phosphatase [Myxococcota bacterium]